jgi:hypothetical protein
MRLRAQRRNLVVWSSAGIPAPTRPRRVRRARGLARTGRVLTLIGLLWVARVVVRPRWQPLLTGVVCTVAGVILRNTSWGPILLVGLMLFAYSVFVPGLPDEDHKRLQHELATYSTTAQRHDFEATLAQYPDTVTDELRDILTRTPRARG